MVSLIFDKKIMFDIFAILSDPMGSKDTPIYKYVCTKALLLAKKTSWFQCIALFDSIYVLNKIFTMLGQLFRTLRVDCKVGIFSDIL